jgi:hypothetical protein
MSYCKVTVSQTLDLTLSLEKETMLPKLVTVVYIL